ncbi:MAG: hypothetical protein ABI813_10155 [Bacteroidota bacterium]
MNITRNNYEEFFMLYADNELPVAQKKEVEAFVAANPDLQLQLVLFQQFKLSPDAAVVFNDKAALLKEEGQPLVTPVNCESFFVLYGDNELLDKEKKAIEAFVRRHPQWQQTFELFQQVKLSPDPTTLFENKKSLYRKESDRRIILLRWWKPAAAAMIFLLAGLFWLNRNKKNQADFDAVGIALQPGKHSPLPSVPAHISGNKGKTERVNGEAIIAATVEQKEQQSNIRMLAAREISAKKDIKYTVKAVQAEEDRAIQEAIADIPVKELKNAVVYPLNGELEKDEVKRPVIATAKRPLTDQPAIVLYPGENDQPKAEWESLATDNTEVLNTSVNTRRSLRPFFRKASRLIAKKTDAGKEDGNRKGILIGGFEITVQ